MDQTNLTVITHLNLLLVRCYWCGEVVNCDSFGKRIMESYLKQLQQGNMGEEAALTRLGLEGIQEVSFTPLKSQPMMETLTAEYSRQKGGSGC